jgi:hypothetical protein
MAGLLALSLANLIALAAPAGTAAPPPTSTASQVTHPTWGDRLRPGTRFPIEGIAFDGRGGPLSRGDGLSDLAAALREAAERLVALGVRADRVAWSGRGGGAPLLPNFTTRERSANRHVEGVVASPSPGT